MNGRVVAIDPGETIGFVSFNADGSVESAFVVVNPQGLEGMFKAFPPDVVVLEDFNRGGPLDIHQKRTMTVIGAVTAHAQAHKAKLVKQTPQERKPHLNAAIAHDVVMASEAAARPHIRDAVAHGLRYFSKMKDN
jgi:hypothetical protein